MLSNHLKLKGKKKMIGLAMKMTRFLE